MLGEEALQESSGAMKPTPGRTPRPEADGPPSPRRTGSASARFRGAHYHGGFSISSRAFMLYDPLVVQSSTSGLARRRWRSLSWVRCRAAWGGASAGKPARLGQSVTRPPASVRRSGSSARRRRREARASARFSGASSLVARETRAFCNCCAERSSAGPTSFPAAASSNDGGRFARTALDLPQIPHPTGQEPLVEPMPCRHSAREDFEAPETPLR